MTNRIDLLNFLIQHHRCQRYLEISMHSEHESYNRVDCSIKKRINFEYPTGSQDSLYASVVKPGSDKFDLVFIDGLHTEEQVVKDIAFAFNNLAPGGIIVLHDCMPPDAWHQRGLEEYAQGENWNGTVWKAALRVFNSSSYKCLLLDIDWGCGIIDTGLTQVPASLNLPQNLEYYIHFDWLLTYRCKLTEYLRNHLTVFYHIACMGNWQDVFKEQILQLKSNGFVRVNLSVLGTKDELEYVQANLRTMNLYIEAVLHDEDMHRFESPALNAIQEYSKEHTGYVLYLHTKGVSNPADESKVKWRRLMMRELVENWESCMMQLLKYDIVGVNWRDMPPISHFCGNFWYASTAYIRKLAEFKAYYEKPLYKIWDRFNDKRLGCEFWIGSGNALPKVLSLYCRNVDFCNQTFWINK